jgi:hypothetical protein
MRAQRAYVGRLARCPACGDNVIISEGGQKSVQRFPVDTRTPVPRTSPRPAEQVPRATPLAEDDDDFFERPRKRRPKRKAEYDGSKVMTWLGLGLLLLISVSALAAATIWLVITPDSGSEAKKGPASPPAAGVYAIQAPPQQTQAAPVTLYIPPPEVSFPLRRNGRSGR